MNGSFGRVGTRALGLLGLVGLFALGCSGTQEIEEEGKEEAPVTTPASVSDEGVVDARDELDRDVGSNAPSLEDAFGEGQSVNAGPCTIAVNTSKELVIRALAVVNDPVRTKWTGKLTNPKDGAWTFGRLMTSMAGTNDPQVFVRNWLSRWETNRTINGFVVPARPAIRSAVIDPWPKDAAGKLDLTKAPLRLLAITNRFDLRNPAAKNAGEGRFVFGVLDAQGNATSFTVILEYKLPAATATDVIDWAKDWHALGGLTLGSAAYNDALQKITDRFAGRNADPAKINGSAISQVRSNEIALAGPWELREFRLASNGQLAQGTVAQTPDLSQNGTTRFADFVNLNEKAILAGRHVVPGAFQNAPFRGGNAPTDFSTSWRATGITNNQARHLVSVNTCNGCHGGETNTTFLHIGVRQANTLAPLSAFLTGTTVIDPVSGQSRTFNDLKRRATDLRGFLCTADELAAPTAIAAAPVNNRVH